MRPTSPAPSEPIMAVVKRLASVGAGLMTGLRVGVVELRVLWMVVLKWLEDDAFNC